jgi:electron transport complex protein RnfC
MVKTISLEGKKESSLNPWTIKRLKYPARVSIPLRQTLDHSSIPCVKIGDHVRVGQKIAEPDDVHSVAVHASLSGKIKGIETKPHLLFGSSVCIDIESDEKIEKFDFIGSERPGWSAFSEAEILQQFQNDGLVEMDEDLFALHQKINIIKETDIHTLVIDICEAEPYVTADHALAMSHPVEILKGAEILRKLINAEKVVFVVQDDKFEVSELLKSKIYFLKWSNYKVHTIPTKYPLGLLVPMMKSVFNENLIPSLISLSRKNPQDSLPIRQTKALAEKGYAHHFMATVFAVYESIVMQKPLYERAMTLSGECVIEPKNVWAPLGYLFKDIIKEAKGFMREPGEILMGGPMQGRKVSHLDFPVLKATKSLLGLPKELTQKKAEEACNHCGDCVDYCPAEISPVMITLAAEKKLFKEAQDWGVEACIECGLCTYVCPANRPMANLLKFAKQNLRQGKKNV